MGIEVLQLPLLLVPLGIPQLSFPFSFPLPSGSLGVDPERLLLPEWEGTVTCWLRRIGVRPPPEEEEMSDI